MEAILQGIWDFLLSILTGIINLAYQIGEGIYNAILWIINAILSIVSFLFDVAGTVLQFLGELLMQILNGIITLFGGIIQFIGMIINAVVTFVIAIVLNIIEIIKIVALVIDVILAAIGVAVAWVIQTGIVILDIIGALSRSPAIPIPFLPHCVTAPTDSQICALWYVFDWTILAPDTPGDFIVPIIVLMIDFVIVIYIIRSIMKMIKWFQSIYRIT